MSQQQYISSTFSEYCIGYCGFGFNGKENDNEVKGTGNSLDFGARIYDSRIGRWLSLDPLQAKYPNLNPYNFCANNPIVYVDEDGRDLVQVTVPANSSGTKTKVILCDKNVAAKVYNVAWAMNKEFGLVVNSHFRSKDKQTQMRENWDNGKRKGLVCQPAIKSAHSSGMALDFNVPKNITEERYEEIAEKAKELGADNLGMKDRVHFFFKETENGYKDRDEAIDVNNEYYKENIDNIPLYNPNESKAEESKTEDFSVDLNKFDYNNSAVDNTAVKKPIAKEVKSFNKN